MQWLIHVKTPAQTCFQNTELTLEMFRKISTSSCHQIPNELSNLLALVATCSTQTVNQNTNVPAEVCKVPIKRTCGLTVRPLIDTCQKCSTSPANHEPRSPANGSFQNPGVCPQAVPSFPSPTPTVLFLALAPFSAQAKYRKPRSSVFLCSQTLRKRLLRRLFWREHARKKSLNLKKSGFLSKEGHGVCKPQNIAIISLK